MIVELDKIDLIRLINGTAPSENAVDDPKIKMLGTLESALEWRWKVHKLNSMSETDLWEVYCICSESWKGVSGV